MNLKRLTPVKAIRTKCLECSGGSYKEVRDCVIPDCALYPYRLGTNPARQGVGQKNGNLPEMAHSAADF